MKTTRFALSLALGLATLGPAWACATGSDSASPLGAGGNGGTGGSVGSAGMAGTAGGGGAIDSGPCENDAAVVAEHAISEASPVVSRERPIVASSGVDDAALLLDGDYRASPAALFGTLEAGPEWVAIDVGAGPTRLSLLLTDAGSGAYTSLAGGAPVGYVIETSPDSRDGEDGEWVTAIEVTDNGVRNRAHSFDFDQMRWVRFTATAASEGRPVRLVELELHDVSAAGEDRPEDGWLFFGDSIHQAAMNRTSSSGSQDATSFDRLVTQAHPAFEPIVLNASIGGEHLSDAIGRLDELLALNPDIQHVAVAYGTNDSWGNQNPDSIGFRGELEEIVESILDAGHTPILARIPYASVAHGTLPAFNSIIDEVRAEYGLPCGPDLYTHFLEHPEQLGSDGVHPNSQGSAAINRLWAEAVLQLYLGD